MANRIALASASLAAALVLAGGLALAGFGPAAPATDMQAADATVDGSNAGADPAADASTGATADQASADPATTPQVQVDTIYVLPQPTPAAISAAADPVPQANHEAGENENEGDD